MLNIVNKKKKPVCISIPINYNLEILINIKDIYWFCDGRSFLVYLIITIITNWQVSFLNTVLQFHQSVCLTFWTFFTFEISSISRTIEPIATEPTYKIVAHIVTQFKVKGKKQFFDKVPVSHPFHKGSIHNIKKKIISTRILKIPCLLCFNFWNVMHVIF